MNKRRIILISTASLLGFLALGAILLDKSGYLVRALKPQVLKALSTATGRPVSVDSVEGGIFGSISLKGVSLGAAAKPQKMDVTLRVEKAVVTFSLWDFFVRHKEAAESLRRLEFHDPIITLSVQHSPQGEAPQALSGVPELDLGAMLAGLPLPPVLTSVEGGRLELSVSPQGQGLLLLDAIQAELSLPSSGASAHLDLGASAYGGHLRAEADFSPSSHAGHAGLDLEGLDLSQLNGAPGMPSGLPLFKAGSLKGKLELKLAPGQEQQWVRGLSVQGGLELAGAALGLPGGGQIEEGAASLQLNERRASLSSLRFKYSGGQWQGSGSVADLRQPQLQANLKGQGPGLSLAGLRVDQASLSITAGAEGLLLDQLLLATGDGRLEASGSWSPLSATSSLNFKGEIFRFPLAGAAGEINGSFALGGALEQLSAQARLDSKGLKFGGENFSNALLSLSLNGKRLGLAASADWRNFKGLSASAQGQLDSGKIALSSLSLKQGSQNLAQGAFSSEFSKDGKIKGRFSLGPLESADLVKAYELPLQVKGPLSASLELSGKAASPLLWAKLSAPQLSSLNGQALPAQAELLLKDGLLSIRHLELRGKELSASGAWGRADSAIEVTLKSAQVPAFLAAGLQAPPHDLAGAVEGSLWIKRNAGGPRLEFSLKAKGLQVGDFAAEAASVQGALEPGDWNFSDLALEQDGGGSLEGHGSFDPHGSASLGLSAKDWKFRERRYSADLELSGSQPGRLRSWFRRAAAAGEAQREIGGDLSVKGVLVSGEPLPALQGTWSWFERGRLEIKDLAWGPGYSAGMDLSRDGAWSAEADLKDADPQPLAVLFRLNKAVLRQGLNAHAEAKGQAGSGSASAKLGTQAVAQLEWSKDPDGSRHWLGSASARAFDLARALELGAFGGIDALKAPARSFSGRLSADLDLDSGRPLPLSFSVGVENLKQGGDAWGSLSLSGSASAQDLRLDLADLGIAKSHLQLRALDFRKAAAGSYRLDSAFESRDFPDQAFFRFGGQGSLHLKLDPDSASGDLHWKSLQVNQASFGPGAAGALWKDRRLTLDDLGLPSRYHAELKIPVKGDPELEALNASLEKNGSLEAHHGLDEEGKRRLEISGRGVDLGLLAGALDWNLQLGGLVYGNAVLRGADTPEGHMKLLVSAKVENGNLEGFPFDLATGSVRLADGRLDLKPLGEPVRVLRRNRYEAEIEGTVPLDTDQPGKAPEQVNMDARLLSGNLGLFDFLDIVDSGSGTLTAELKIKGTAKYPEYSGKMEVSGGTLKFKRLMAPATDLQGKVFVDQNKLEILRLDAQMGDPGQRIYVERGSGSDPAISFDQWIIAAFNLHLSSAKAGIRFQSNDRYDFIAGTLLPDLLLSGSWDEPHFQGKVSLANATITYPIVDKDAKPSLPKDFSSRLMWDVGVKAGDNVLFTNSVARVELLTDDKGVRLYGPGKDITLEGNVRPLRGRLTFFSSDFQIDDAHDNHIDFLGEAPPSLNLWASKTVRSAQGFDTPIELQVSGSLGSVQMHLSSANTDLTDAQLGSMAGLGVDLTDAGVNEFGGAVVSMAGKFVVGKLFGLFSNKFKGMSNLDVNVSAPGIFGGTAGSQSSTAESSGNTLSARDIGQVEVGTYLPGSKLYGTAGLAWKEGANGSTQEVPKVGVEIQVGQGKKIAVSSASDENRVEYQAQSSMDNYNPRKRREEIEERRLRKLATATPTPAPSPSPMPSPTPENP